MFNVVEKILSTEPEIKLYNITITRGDTGVLEVIISDKLSGALYEMQTGDVLILTVKKNSITEDILIQKKSLDTTIRIESSDTKGKPYGKYVYDVQLNCANGIDVHTVIPKSEFIIAEEVTF